MCRWQEKNNSMDNDFNKITNFMPFPINVLLANGYKNTQYHFFSTSSRYVIGGLKLIVMRHRIIMLRAQSNYNVHKDYVSNHKNCVMLCKAI